MSDVSRRTYDLDWSLPTGEHAADVTIRPQITADADTLPPLDLGEWSPIDAPNSDLVVREALASGGMGTVYLARQRSLDRVVAIKRAPGGDARLAAALVREAKFLGRLTHPNIVPVYAVGHDGEGVPAVVMKHVEGATWREALDAPVDRHLEILEQVCNAVDYAHDRGVLHRDLKPDNVMIGAHGEVYLMDWGIAVDVGHRAERIAGTPAYFAPEQLSPGQPLTRATDLFQLGACLYEVLTGSPPFMAPTVAESLASAHAGPAPLPDTVPAELRDVCLRAMAADPADRFDSAAALRERLAWYRRHAASMVLSQAAATSLAGLADALDEPERAEQLFTEAHFGFRQALATCPDNEQASRGLVEALRQMGRHRADRGDARGARALLAELAELGAADSELAGRVERVADERARTEALARDVDLRTHGQRRTRLFLGFAIFSALFVGAWAVLLTQGLPLVSYESAVLSMAFIAAVVWTGLFLARGWILRTAANRSLAGTSGFIVLAMLGMRIASARLGLDLRAIFALDLLLMGLASASASLALTPRLAPIGAFFAVGATLIVAFPSADLPLYIGFMAVGLLLTAVGYARITPVDER